MPKLAPVLWPLLAVLLGACSLSISGSSGTATPVATATQEPTPLPPSTIISSITASCRLLLNAAEISIDYRASARGGVLTRVRLVQDGFVVEDSGNIAEPEWRRIETYPAGGGSTHVYQVQIEAGSLRSSSARNIVRCPAALPANRV